MDSQFENFVEVEIALKMNVTVVSGHNKVR